MICERPACAGNGFRRDDRAELLVLQGRLCKPGQVERSGIIFAAVQPVRVGKVRLRQAQRTGAQIHLADKRCFAAGNGDCQRQGGIIAGMEHHAVEQLAARKRLAAFQVHAGALGPGGGFRHGHGSVQVARLADEKAGHDLCRARNQRALIPVFLVKTLSCRPIKQGRAFGRHLRRRRELRGAGGADGSEEKGGGAECRRRFSDCFLNAAFHSASPC